MGKPQDRSDWAEKIWSGELDPDKTVANRTWSLVKRFFEEVWNKGNLSVVDEVLAHNYVDYNPPPGAPRGRKGYKASVNMFRTAFPDIQFTLDQILAEGRSGGNPADWPRHSPRQFYGTAPTGKQVSFGGMAFIRIEDGQGGRALGNFGYPRFDAAAWSWAGQTASARSGPEATSIMSVTWGLRIANPQPGSWESPIFAKPPKTILGVFSLCLFPRFHQAKAFLSILT